MKPDIRKHSKKVIPEWRQGNITNAVKIGWMEETGRWKGLKSIGMVSKTMIKAEKTVIEKRYYIARWI